MNKRVISADCLASVYSKNPSQFCHMCRGSAAKKRTLPLYILTDMHCVIQENIHTPPPHGGQWKFRGEGGSKFLRGWGAASRIGPSSCFPGASSKIDDQAISYFTINQCCKAKIIVFIDDLLFAVRCTFFTACMIVYVT